VLLMAVESSSPRLPFSASACGDECCTSITDAVASTVPSERRFVLAHRVRLLVAATISYNVIEAVVAISAGVVAGSTALIGFGLDSVIEVSSAAIVAWQFRSPDHESRERVALRLIAYSFFALAAFVTFESLRALLGSAEVDHSTVGIVLVRCRCS
jgi:hypothetical protein